MNELIVFQNEELGSIRALTIDGEPYFVGRDVAEILGYAKPQNAIAAHVDSEDRKAAPIQGTPGGTQEMTIINESGLYSLILSSKLPSAKRFKRWITSQVLPSIRKHGAYARQELIEKVIADPDYGIQLFMELKESRRIQLQLSSTIAIQNQQIAELQPKATYYDEVLSCPDALPVSCIAKDYGWSAKKMNRFLHDQGVQYKLGKTWLLYVGHAEMGYTVTETVPYPGKDGTIHTAVHTKWTQKGRLFIYDLMKSAGYLPRMERKD